MDEDSQLTRFEVVDSAGNLREFWLQSETDFSCGRQVRKYFVHVSNPPDPRDDVYFARFDRVAEDLWQASALEHRNQAHYQGRGLTPAILERCHLDTSELVQSSSNHGGHQQIVGEYRTVDASRVWDTMLARGLAYYDPQTDHYRLFSADSDRRIAIHEAGHATMAYALGGRINHIWIRRDHTNLRGTNLIEARVNWDIRQPASLTVNEVWAYSAIRIATAIGGPIAETLAFGKARGQQDDFRRANGICRAWGLTLDEGNELQMQACQLVRQLETGTKALATKLQALPRDSVPDDEFEDLEDFLQQDRHYVRRGGFLDSSDIEACLRDAGIKRLESPALTMPERLRELDIDPAGVFAALLQLD